MTIAVERKSETPGEPASPPADGRRRRRRVSGKPNSAGPITYVVIALVTLVSIFPLYYTVVMASHTNSEMAKKVPPFLPNHTFFSNVRQALKIAPLNKGLINSLIVSGTIAIGTVAFCTLAGFAFAKLRFRGSGFLLGFCIATMMVPTQMGIIPLYMFMARL